MDRSMAWRNRWGLLRSVWIGLLVDHAWCVHDAHDGPAMKCLGMPESMPQCRHLRGRVHASIRSQSRIYYQQLEIQELVPSVYTCIHIDTYPHIQMRVYACRHVCSACKETETHEVHIYGAHPSRVSHCVKHTQETCATSHCLHNLPSFDLFSCAVPLRGAHA